MALASIEERTRRTTFQKSVAILKPKLSVVNPRFLYYLLLCENKRLSDFAGGTAQKNLLLKDLRAFPITLPTLPVQEAVSSILTEFDALIENNLRRIKILEEMAQMIYREWFVSFRFPGRERTSFAETEVGVIPSDWKIYRFSELLLSSSGGDWGSDVYTEEECASVCVIRGTDFADIRSGASMRTPQRFITSANLTKKKLRNGDILIENSVNAKTRSAGSGLLISQGILKRLQGDSIAASFCRVFRLNDPALAPVVYLHLRHLYLQGQMAYYQNVAANGIANFQTTRFLTQGRLALPSDKTELRNMIDVLTDLTSSNLADRIYKLRETRDLLLPKLISGEISVEHLDSEIVAQNK
jgi:type I restriction enzyme S subunit